MTPKTLNVPLLPAGVSDMDTAIELYGARFDVDCVNWPSAFPYAPLCSGRVARTADALVVDFRVSGMDLRARNQADNLHQWEDSCVEVFIENPDGSAYYNFEINPLGKVLAASGPVREGRETRPQDEMGQILRFAQNDILQPEELAAKDLEGVQTWRIGVVIPFRLVGADPANLPPVLKANFYKCGDKTAHPHFLSWSPVGTPQPDFHRPDFFGQLRLV